MIHDLKLYPEYKDSGVPWLGEVPKHWKTNRLRRVSQCLDGKRIPLNGPEREKMQGLYPYWGANRVIDHVNEWLFDEELVLLGEDGAPFLEQNRDVAFYVKGKIWVNNHAHVLRPKNVVAQYLAYALNCVDYVTFIDGATRDKLTQQAMKDIFILDPELNEQSAIVRYLNYINRRIRRYIRAKQKLITLLEEQKQVIIHQAVTRGLDPNVKLKLSGAEWLGDIPEHWEAVALRRYWEVIDCKHVTVPFVEEGVPLASVREVQNFDLNLSTSKRTTKEWYSHMISGGRLPKKGDLIYCRNVSVGACALVTNDEIFAMGQDVCLIRSENENGRFLNYFMHSPAMQRQLSLVLIGSTFNRINVSEIKSLVIAVPPRNEQDSIVSSLDANLSKFNKQIELTQKEISLLCEYRTRLMADVVTGKLDVREAAANLLYEVEETEIEENAEEYAEEKINREEIEEVIIENDD